MARLLIYDAYENKVYTYANLNENDPMPYSTGTTLRVREFRGKSASPTLWTTIAAMEAWNLTRRKYGSGIPVGYAFRRIWEGGHGTRSQHYAGVSFDVGQTLSQRQRTALYQDARNTGAWGYVEPLSQTPTWVHFDRRYGTPACSGTTAGYPTLRRGSRGCYVMILQDALSTLGYQTGSRIDGVFGARTEEALRGYQRRTSLSGTGCAAATAGKRSAPPCWAWVVPRPPSTDFLRKEARKHQTPPGFSFFGIKFSRSQCAPRCPPARCAGCGW